MMVLMGILPALRLILSLSLSKDLASCSALCAAFLSAPQWSLMGLRKTTASGFICFAMNQTPLLCSTCNPSQMPCAKAKPGQKLYELVSILVLDKGKNSGAHDLAIDLQIDRVICHGGKNPPLCDLDCIGRFMVLFDVQLLCLILFNFKKL